MFAGYQTFECKQGKKLELTMFWKQTVLPLMSKQGGCKGTLLLMDPESNKCTGIELWDNDIAASSFDSNGSFKDLSAKLAPMVVAPPERVQYQVMAQSVVTG